MKQRSRSLFFNSLRTQTSNLEPRFHSRRFYYQKHPKQGVRLVNVDRKLVLHDKQGFRPATDEDGVIERFEYAPDYRLLRVQRDGKDIRFEHDEHGMSEAKYVNGQLVERYKWLDFIRLEALWTREGEIRFVYEKNARIPCAMSLNGEPMSIHCDQVGSIRVVADSQGRVITEILYDSFGRVLKRTNPAFSMPLGFAGGLHDQDTGLVRFGWRDYDPETGRFTAPDPMGDAGGDPDWYGYCLDDPVNGVDPLGLFWESVGGRVLKQGLFDGAIGAMTGAGAGLPFAGVGAGPGAIVGAMAGFTRGLLTGTANEIFDVPTILPQPQSDQMLDNRKDYKTKTWDKLQNAKQR